MIAALNSDFAKDAPEELLQVNQMIIDCMIDEAASRSPLGVGARFPSFALPDQVGAPTHSADLLSMGPMVISFYRGLWCPYCQLELRYLQLVLPEIRARGAQLVAISPQLPDGSLTTAQKLLLDFTILSDSHNQFARSCGIEVHIPTELRAAFNSVYTNYEDLYSSDAFALPMPATFVVDPQGIIQYAFVSPDYSVRAEPAEVLATLEGLDVMAS